MTSQLPENLIPFLSHDDPLVRRYTARLLGLADEGQIETYLKDILA